jgi:hypothetical protein
VRAELQRDIDPQSRGFGPAYNTTFDLYEANKASPGICRVSAICGSAESRYGDLITAKKA